MSQDQVTVICPLGEWTEITNTDVTALTMQALSAAVYLRGTVGAVPPTVEDGRLYQAGTGFENKAMADLFYTTGKTRVFVKPAGSATARVYVDHV